MIHIMHVLRTGSADGGMENGVINVTNRLDPERFRVSICVLDREETFSARIRRPGVEYHLLPPKSGGVEWRWIGKLARLFRDARVDIVHSHNWGTFLYCAMAARMSGTTIVHGEHGLNFGELTEVNRVKDWTKKILGNRIDRLVSVSPAIRAEWISRFRVPDSKVLCIPNGVDTERFAPSGDRCAARRALGLPGNAFVVGSVGRLDPIKNYSLLLRAARLLAEAVQPVVVALIGEGPSRQALTEEARQLGIADQVYFLGRRRDVERCLPALDVFVLPSISEGMSNVVLEAMSAGLPVVCPSLPAHREIIDSGENGILLDPCPDQILAATLAELHRDAGQRQTLGSNARLKICARFSLRRMVEQHESLYLALRQEAG